MKIVVWIGISIILSLNVTLTARSADGLVGAWLFDEDSGNEVKDLVGGNNGEINGSIERTNESQFGRALKLPGKGDSYVSIPHDDVFDAEPYTFTAWVKLEQASWQYIVWKNGTVWPEPHKKRHLDIWVHDADYAVFMWHTENGGEGRLDGQTLIADGEWHHVAKVCDGSTFKMYIDGALEGETEVGGELVLNGEDPMWIGARPGDVAATGIFDEVGFFTEALSEDELATVMDDGLDTYAAVELSGKLAVTWGQVKIN